jgi:DNA-binding MarR family transcriptional regulator
MEPLEHLLTIVRIKTACDLDLLLFFARHPDALMTSEQLASFVGYDLPQIAKSLDLLVQRKLLRRTQNPTHAARLYRFRADYGGPRFHELLKGAMTIEGRRRIRRLLSERQSRPKRPAPRNKLSNVSQTESRITVSHIKEKAHG